MSIDLDAAEGIFAQSRDGTVGLEEEFAILDPATLELANGYETISAAALDDDLLRESVAGELISSEVEIRSGPGDDLVDAIARQRERRQRLFALADSQGYRLASTGTHPWSDYREQHIIDTDHYDRVEDGLKYVAWRNNTFSMHVHVGVNDLERAVKVCDRLRPVLPLLLAISANSPFLDGRDSGLHSARTQTFTKSFPRCGIPESYGGWRNFREYLELLIETNSIVEYTQIWWSVRPHLSFGTVEVRICDAQMTAAESEGLSALITACILQAARDIDEGVPYDDPAPRLIEENFWRAIRYGLDGKMVDFADRSEFQTAGALDRLLNWTEPVRSEGSIDVSLPSRNGAQRQRDRIAAGDSMQEIYAATVAETENTYAEEKLTNG